MSASLIASLALVVAFVAVVGAVLAMRQLRAVRRNFEIVWGGGAAGDVAAVIRAQHDRLTAVDQRVSAVSGRVDAVSGHVAAGLRHVSVVRYDAFGDMGGRLSFSAAILDDAGDGLVLSSIHARGESRTYAKAVADGKSQLTLTPEEQQALATAMSDRKDA